MIARPCPCGSGLPRCALHEPGGRRLLGFTCERCHQRRAAQLVGWLVGAAKRRLAVKRRRFRRSLTDDTRAARGGRGIDRRRVGKNVAPTLLSGNFVDGAGQVTGRE
jgi:hypothetical protein